MAAARIAAFALALFSCAALSQNPAMGSITVTVIDESGALIGGARFSATKIESGVRLEATAGRDGPATGQATLKLKTGRYRLRVEAKAFKSWEEEDVEVNAEVHRAVTLPIDNNFLPCTLPCDGFAVLVIPGEHVLLDVNVPLIPIQQFVPPAKRLRIRP